MNQQQSLPLNQYKVHRISIIINWFFFFIQSIALYLLMDYRVIYFGNQETKIIPWLLVFASELLLSFIWMFRQLYHLKPVSRTTFPDRLPKNKKEYPGIDVIICTADPDKEPTLEVMNTVLSAMSLDYPVEKLNIYLSDDAGSSVTLRGMREARRFGTWWLPFCRKYCIKIGSPEAYFSSFEDDSDSWSSHFLRDKELVKEKYEVFKEKIVKVRLEDKYIHSTSDHHAVIEVIGQKEEEEKTEMPLIVYVAREKSPSRPHNFKAGALNVLFRVSGIISNSPYILVLDCDMLCNDRSSAKQAMCFHFDPEISPSIAFIQFPQTFNNISSNDIYDSRNRTIFHEYAPGMDGLSGTCLAGTNFYIKRKSLYGPSVHEDIDLSNARQSFGTSNMFIKSLHQDYKPNTIKGQDSLKNLLQETVLLASCTYEDETHWGKKVGFMYVSVVEDFFTSFILHCRGWKSVYLNPSRPQFLGTGVTNLNDLLIQGTRWSSGLCDVGLSRFFPMIYGPLHMSFLQSMCYTHLAFYPILYCLPLWCLATIPQLCLVNGLPLYPQVSNPMFKMYLLIFVSYLSKDIYEILITGGSVQTWINEQRIWMIKSITSYLFGSLDTIMKKLKLRQASFITTNKVVNNEQVIRYQRGMFDFQASPRLLMPLVTLVLVNLFSLVGGIARGVVNADLDKMLIQVFISVYVLVVNYAVLEGMILRKDSGRIAPSVSITSLVFACMFLIVGSILLLY